MFLFEEIQMPSTAKHWHPFIKNYEIFPAEFDKSSIVHETLLFKNAITNN